MFQISTRDWTDRFLLAECLQCRVIFTHILSVRHHRFVVLELARNKLLLLKIYWGKMYRRRVSTNLPGLYVTRQNLFVNTSEVVGQVFLLLIVD